MVWKYFKTSVWNLSKLNLAISEFRYINADIGLKWYCLSEDYIILMTFSWWMFKLTQFDISQLKISAERIYRIYRFSIQNIVSVLKFQYLPALLGNETAQVA